MAKARSTTPRARKPAKPVVEIGLADLAGMTGDVTDDLRSDKKRDVVWSWQKPTAAPLGADAPTILAFDPGKETGWARFDRDGPFSGGLMKTHHGARIEPGWLSLVRMRIEDFKRGKHEMWPALVVVEDAFLMRGPGGVVMAPDNTFRLVRLIGAIQTVATEYKLPSVRVQPPTWQAACLGRLRREEGKAASLTRARQLFGAHNIETDHAADAALISWWARGGHLENTR